MFPPPLFVLLLRSNGCIVKRKIRVFLKCNYSKENCTLNGINSWLFNRKMYYLWGMYAIIWKNAILKCSFKVQNWKIKLHFKIFSKWIWLILKGMLYYAKRMDAYMGMSFWKKLRCGHRKISRLTTPLTIYRVGLRGNSAHKSTWKHRFRTKKHLKYPEITQKITPNLFGTQRSWVRIPSPRPKITDSYPAIRYFFVAYFVSKLKGFSDFYHSPKHRPFLLKKYAFANRSPNWFFITIFFIYGFYGSFWKQFHSLIHTRATHTIMHCPFIICILIRGGFEPEDTF